MSEPIMYADAPDEGLHTFIIENESLTSEEKRYLREWKKKIHTMEVDPYNVLLVIYLNDDSVHKIKVGNGNRRVIIELSDCTDQVNKSLQAQCDSRRMEVTVNLRAENIIHGSSGREKTAGGAAFGAAAMGGVYFGLAANPVSGPLVCAATVGAMMGAGAAEYIKEKPIPDSKRIATVSVKIPIEDIDRLPDLLEKYLNPSSNALQ